MENRKISLKKRYTYILALWKEQRWRVLLLIFLSLVNTTASIVYPLILRTVIDSIGNNGSKSTIANAIAFLISAAAIGALFYSALQANRLYTNISFGWRMVLQLLQWILKQEKKFFHTFNHGELLTRLSDDVEKLSWAMCTETFRFFDSISIITFALVFMFGFSWKLTVLVFLPIAIVSFAMAFSDKYIDSLFQKLQEKISSVNAIIEKAFASIKIIKSNCMEEFSNEEFAKILGERKKAEMKLAFFNGIWNALDMLINQGAILGILYIGGTMVIKHSLPLGTFVAFMQFFYLMFEYLYSFAYFFVTANSALVCAGRHVELLDYRAEEPQNLSAISAPEPIEDLYSVEFRNVTLVIENRKVLDNVSFRAERGTFLGITGEIGAGKSLCMELLCGIERPTTGEILVNGISLAGLNGEEYREKIGMVFQEPLLFSSSIEENIVLPQENSDKDIYTQYNNRVFLKNLLSLKADKAYDELHDDEQVEAQEPLVLSDDDKKGLEHALGVASLTDDIPMFPDGLATLVGPKGITVSGGQRERITIARAVYRNPALYIFDDSTRSLDYETERNVIRKIRGENKSTLIIMVTQRLSSIAEADNILVFQNGRITGEGTHQQLLETCADYQRLQQREKAAER